MRRNLTALANDRVAGPVVACRRVVQVYGEAGAEVAALRGIDLELARGESLAVLGPSGAGKSTLLWLIAGLSRPSAGEVEVDGVPLGTLAAAGLRQLRARSLGVVLQNPGRNLLPQATCRENVLFAGPPGRGVRAGGRRAQGWAVADLLGSVGLHGRGDDRAGALSGGEQQRLALAVALAGRPPLLLADEPTSQLDATSAAAVVDLMLAANAGSGTAVLVVTHDPAVAEAMSRTVTIHDGRVGRQTRDGREHVVVGTDGQVHLPDDVLAVLPPGTVLGVERLPDGVRLRREEP